MTGAPIKVDADANAVAFIQERGGRLFVWASNAGIEHETTKPREGIDFVRLEGNGFELFVDPSIDEAHRWRLVYHRFPTPHVRALWNGGAYSVGLPLMSKWEGDPPSTDS